MMHAFQKSSAQFRAHVQRCSHLYPEVVASRLESGEVEHLCDKRQVPWRHSHIPDYLQCKAQHERSMSGLEG